MVTDDSHMTRQSSVSDQHQPRRDEIMAAAKKVFARNGFDGTTIADVAKQAGPPF
jgi:AcrR family transcriptional regulator